MNLSPERPAKSAASASAPKPHRVLIVDDDASIRESLRLLLTEAYDCHVEATQRRRLIDTASCSPTWSSSTS